MPEYQDQSKLDKTEAELKTYPPLVFAGEARELKNNLAEVSEGKHFYYKAVIIESFEDFNADYIRDTFKVLLQMSVTLTAAGNVPVKKLDVWQDNLQNQEALLKKKSMVLN